MHLHRMGLKDHLGVFSVLGIRISASAALSCSLVSTAVYPILVAVMQRIPA
jgi:hypothetical protein